MKKNQISNHFVLIGSGPLNARGSEQQNLNGSKGKFPGFNVFKQFVCISVRFAYCEGDKVVKELKQPHHYSNGYICNGKKPPKWELASFSTAFPT